jgi:hypothetical protein
LKNTKRVSFDRCHILKSGKEKRHRPDNEIKNVFCFLFILTFTLIFSCKMTSSNNRKGPPPEQLWKSWDRKARKQGFHSTIYSSDGSQYKGEWTGDKKHGKRVDFI